MKRWILTLSALVLALFSNGTARAAGIINGGFEQPAVAPGTFLTIAPGAEGVDGFNGWTVTTGNVDVVNASAPVITINWGANATKDGQQLLDLNGTIQGGISQSFATTTGQNYTLTYWLSNNPLSVSTPTHSADVTLTDVGTTNALLASQSVTHSNATTTDPMWVQETLLFTAQGATTSLAFTSTSGALDPSGGVVLDAVDVSPSVTPEPASLTLLAIGIAGMAGYGWRRKKTAAAT